MAEDVREHFFRNGNTQDRLSLCGAVKSCAITFTFQLNRSRFSIGVKERRFQFAEVLTSGHCLRIENETWKLYLVSASYGFLYRYNFHSLTSEYHLAMKSLWYQDYRFLDHSALREEDIISHKHNRTNWSSCKLTVGWTGRWFKIQSRK